MEAVDWDALVAGLVDLGILLGKAVLVYIAGKLAARVILGVMERLLKRSKTDEMLIRFALSISSFVLTLIVVIIALSVLGVDTTSLVAVLASAGLAIGLALQDSMKNFASGVMLLVFKPFNKGDFVEVAGTEGVVQEISLFSTDLKTTDNKHVIVPNGAIWTNVITNFTTEDIRRIDMVFGIGYEDDIAAARAVIEAVLAGESRILEEPQPSVAVAELADSSVNFIVRPWVRTEDYWDVKFAVTEAIKLAFDERGVSIPFPQMDVHVDQLSPGSQVS